MNLELHFRNSDFAEALETYLERRLQFALSAFAGKVGRVTVCLTDSDGRRGRPLKRCELTVELLPSGRLLAAESDSDLYVAVDRALRRLLRQLRREVDRRRRPEPRLGACFRRRAQVLPGPGLAEGGIYAGTQS